MSTYAQQLREVKKHDFERFLNLLGRFSVHLALLIFGLACLVPLLLIVSASFTDETALTLHGYGLLPAEFSLEAYELIFKQPDAIIRAYIVTIFTTIVGTAISVTLMSMLAYPLSRRDFFLRRPLSFFVFFTMLFNGGIVPYYILMTQFLRVQDTVLALLLPHFVGVFYVLILRTYFAGLPTEIFDAARVDGAGEVRIFFLIVLPLSKPALATIGLFVALNYWNDWTTPLYFIRDANLYPLQYLLYIIQSNADAMNLNPDLIEGSLPTQTTRMAMAVLATGPAAIMFLFFQKYLVRGITLGSFK
ncbi:MAG: sugar ABC transporter permease [Anaerolineaceae bacterium]|nr:sugar ABC transporter permease [Anaerolineaceae bacterium]